MTIDQYGGGIDHTEGVTNTTSVMDRMQGVDNQGMASLKPTERLFIEKTLIQMYPRLQRHDLIPWKWFNGPMIPDFIVSHTDSGLRRIVEIGCGDGLFSNMLSLLFPDIEIIGIDADRDKIAYARSTIGYRRNVKFICANATVLSEIPCDRIVYNRCLSRGNSTYAFKKMVLKTSQWIVDEGDFIVKESPLAVLSRPALLRELFPAMWQQQDVTACVRNLLRDVGYLNPTVYHSPGVLGMPAEMFHRVSRREVMAGLNVGNGLHAMTGEWQEDWGAQSNDSLVNFLFANAEADFVQELV